MLVCDVSTLPCHSSCLLHTEELITLVQHLRGGLLSGDEAVSGLWRRGRAPERLYVLRLCMLCAAF